MSRSLCYQERQQQERQTGYKVRQSKVNMQSVFWQKWKVVPNRYFCGPSPFLPEQGRLGGQTNGQSRQWNLILRQLVESLEILNFYQFTPGALSTVASFAIYRYIVNGASVAMCG